MRITTFVRCVFNLILLLFDAIATYHHFVNNFIAIGILFAILDVLMCMAVVCTLFDAFKEYINNNFNLEESNARRN